MKLIQKLVPKSKWSIKCPYKMKPTRVVVHNTANKAKAENEINYMIRNNNYVSYHWAVDDKVAIQGIPHDRNAWASGDGAYGKGNREGIHVEICYSKSGGSRFDKAEQNGAKLVAMILKERGWGLDKVTKHQDYSRKYCPHRTLDLGWKRFLKMVEKELDTKVVKKNTIKTKPKRIKKTNSQLATEVINGLWGSGDARKSKLTKAGYNYNSIQKIVNDRLIGKKKPKKSIYRVAKEVINGKWGNGQNRKNNLKKAGYDHSEVQKKVNQLLK